MFGLRNKKAIERLEWKIDSLRKEIAIIQKPYEFEIGDKVTVCYYEGDINPREIKYDGEIVSRKREISTYADIDLGVSCYNLYAVKQFETNVKKNGLGVQVLSKKINHGNFSKR